MSTDVSVFLSVFGVIFIAELPDKTALASLVLATRYRAAAVFTGAALALTVQSAIAVAAGQLVSLLPVRPVHIGAGLLFLVSSWFMWRRSTEDDGEAPGKEPEGFFKQLATVFGVVFVAEWGDLTQLGTAALAARYKAPGAVFLGSTAALWSVVALMVLLGNRAGHIFKPEQTKKVAAVIFAAVGLAMIFGLL